VADWLVWLIAAGILAAAEISSLTFVLIMFSGGALAGSIVAALGAPVVLQVLVAIAATAVLLVGVRPVAQRHLAGAAESTTGSDALVGQQAIVLSEVTAHDGRVRLNGAEWSARAFDATQVVPAGTVVRVMKIAGATAVVLHEEPYLRKEIET
jgi:membrane protein implicated in regulation of membrane protease activity